MITEQSGLVGTARISSNFTGGWAGPAHPCQGAQQTIDNNVYATGLTVLKYPINAQTSTVGYSSQSWELNTIVNSLHPGGVNAVFADGSVHFLRETTDLPVLLKLCARDDGQGAPDID